MTNENESAKEHNPDRTDLSWDYTAHDAKLALLSLEKKTLAQIESAMQRLETGSYGKCVQCGAGIDPERLEVLPYATLCVSCQNNMTRAVRGCIHSNTVLQNRVTQQTWGKHDRSHDNKPTATGRICALSAL